MTNSCAVKSSDICAVLTTFDPTSKVGERVFAILEQLGSVIVVNDSGRRDVAEYLDSLFGQVDRVTLIHNEFNSGIAASLNFGVNKAKEKSFSWVVTMDDDSDITGTFICDLIEFMSQCSASDNDIGVYSLSRYDGCENKLSTPALLYKRAVITSGCIFSTDVFESAGGFDEGLFIDLVDYDFCTNVRALGLKIAQSKIVGMRHTVGASESINILGCKINVLNHHPFRNYYQVRNSIRFARKHLRSDFLLSVRMFLQIFVVPCKAILFESHKLARVHYCSLGLFHGFLGRGGALKVNT